MEPVIEFVTGLPHRVKKVAVPFSLPFFHEYGKLLAESREQALDRMVGEAEALGANAVVATRFTTSMMMGGAAELLAVGTAVVTEDED